MIGFLLVVTTRWSHGDHWELIGTLLCDVAPTCQ